MNEKILVNKTHPCPKVKETTFVKEENSLKEEILLDKRASKAYQLLKKNLKEQGIDIELASGYRSFSEQQEIIDEFQKEYGDDYVKKYVAKVGESEHHTGLCFDIYLEQNGKKILENDDLLAKEQEPVFQKIHQELSKVGLILRYPKGKETITGYSYEPWHFRYVGKSTAQKIEQEQLTLEEYEEKYNRSGVLLVNKPKGMTSREVVNKLTFLFDTQKIGHNGTLDPLATGVLVITINQATKINELLTACTKEYIATVKVGYKTDTLDVEGIILEKGDSHLTQEKLQDVFQTFPREYDQEVPLYSAKKVKGKKLYQYARENKEVSLPKQHVILYELELQNMTEDSFTFRTVVSKGTYIRSLIRDLSLSCGQFFTMSNLIRTKQGKFSLEECYALDDITSDTPFLSIQEALDMKALPIPVEEKTKIKNGHPIKNQYGIKDFVLFEEQGKEIAIYQAEGENLRSYKQFSSI